MPETMKHKRCPFCGGIGGMSYYKMAPHEEIAFSASLLHKCDGHWYSIVCEDCDSATADYFTPDAAWEAWDKRV